MAKKTSLVAATEWAKHLRPYGKRLFYKKERAAAKKAVETAKRTG